MDHDEDTQLFRLGMQGVVPLKERNQAELVLSRRRPAKSSPASDDVVGLGLSDHLHGETANEFLRSGLARMTLRKLRRGQFPPQDTLDLHGLSLDGARSLLAAFLRQSGQHSLRCVCVIHGKGRSFDGGDGPLKRNVRHWLSQHPQVLAYCEPAAMHGGGGAVWVLLRR
jgi:DNA-nicking Smr family endonuclease